MELIYEYIKNRILDAHIFEEPYPHILIENVFPVDFYKKLLDNIPHIDDFTPKPKYPGKETLTLENLEPLDDTKKDFWVTINNWLKSDDFANFLLNKFSIKKTGKSNFFLHKDLSNYEVTPHTDVKSKLVTYLFYLPKDDSLREMGTIMLIPKNGKIQHDRTQHQRWEDFDIVKQVEYLPNSFLAFTPNDNSYHAVKINFPENVRKERDTIRGFVFDMSADDYPAYLFENKN